MGTNVQLEHARDGLKHEFFRTLATHISGFCMILKMEMSDLIYCRSHFFFFFFSTSGTIIISKPRMRFKNDNCLCHELVLYVLAGVAARWRLFKRESERNKKIVGWGREEGFQISLVKTHRMQGCRSCLAGY